MAEHTFMLLLALEKNLLFHTDLDMRGWRERWGMNLLKKPSALWAWGGLAGEGYPGESDVHWL